MELQFRQYDACVQCERNGNTPDGRPWVGMTGGWFSIRALQKLLLPAREVRWDRALKKMPPSDMGLVSPGYLALDVLQRIVRNPPISQSQHSLLLTEAQTKIWNEWIAAHQVELEKLEPIGDGVDFSDKACKNGKPVKKP